ncbi:MAG: PQQ-dependent sugar dehydrogenase [Chloroflexota bacterium]
MAGDDDDDDEPSTPNAEGPRPVVAPTPVPRPGLRQDTYVEGLALPVAFEFDPAGRLFVNELEGRVRLVEGRTLRPEPVITLPTTRGLEQGATGLALDPDFARNHYVYILYAEAREGTNEPRRHRIIRFMESNGTAGERTVIYDNLPIGKPAPNNVNGDHNGGRIGFGRDGKLYVTMGDTAQRTLASRLPNPHGKMLRLNPDGSVPDDNPYPKLATFASGFRSPFGLDFHPVSGEPYVTDNGPKGHDEVNRVVPRGHYGWPSTVTGGPGPSPVNVAAVWDSGSDRYGPTGMAFYRGDAIPELKHNLLFCDWNSGSLWRLILSGPNFDQASPAEVLAQPCRLDVRNGPDGAVYFSDHRAIYRLGP